MKKLRVFLLIAMSFQLLQLTSCGKIDDFFHKPTEPAAKSCNVSKLEFKYQGDSPNSPDKIYYFTYNSYGNPVSAISPTVSVEFYNFYFLYDKKQRLTDLIMPYPAFTGDSIPRVFNFLYYIKYTYVNDSKALQPVADTFHSFGAYNNGAISRCATCPFPYVTNYEYDAEGRISKTTTNYNGQISRQDFNYDARGNLIRSGAVYDDKVNVNRTNAVWMFTNKDYSRNNPFVADTYNTQGLPEKTTHGAFFLQTNFTTGTFSYSCDAK